MRRREFITLLGGAATAWPLAARGQQLGKLPTIGFLGESTPSGQRQWAAAFVQRLPELGWVEGRNIAIEYRWAEGRNERFAELVAELVRLKVDAIVTQGTPSVLAAKPFEARTPSEFQSVFSKIIETRPDAIAVPDDAVFIANAGTIAKVMANNQLPSVGFVNLAQVGGLIGYGVNFPDLWHRAAYFVDRILKGAKPADLPIQQPTKFQLVINQKTAKVLGIAIPPQLLARADEVIE